MRVAVLLPDAYSSVIGLSISRRPSMRGGIGIMHELRRKERSTTDSDIRQLTSARNYTFPASSQPSTFAPRCDAKFFHAPTIADNTDSVRGMKNQLSAAAPLIACCNAISSLALVHQQTTAWLAYCSPRNRVMQSHSLRFLR
jgi:hypothetical protein